MFWLLLLVIGLFVGAFGTLIGVAGGFVLIPILLLLYPQAPPVTITAMTLVVVFFNAFSGSVAYARLRRTDFRSGLQFSITAVPGAVLGAILTDYLSRSLFQYVFGALLLLVAIYLLIRPYNSMKMGVGLGGTCTRTVTDAQGRTFTYTYNRAIGMAFAFLVGIISGLLGIGGGVIHVPILSQLLCFPVHIATATSHFVVAVTAFAAIVTHIIKGTLTEGLTQALVISVGAVTGAQFGAAFSQRVSGPWIVRLLAVALAMVALRLLIKPL